MNFLQEVYLNNTVKSYLVAAGIILFVLFLKKYLSQYIASLLYRLVQKTWKSVSRKSFIDLIVDPIKWFLFILISVFTIDKLNFPLALHYTIYGHTTQDIVGRLANGIIILSFTWLVLRIVDFIAVVLEEKANLTVDTRDNQLIVFFRDFLKVIIGIIGVLLIVKACFNQPIGNVLTGLSIVGAALALAAKESLENLIASFIIFFDEPFFTGDVVKVNNISGTIERIGLRSTRIRTVDNTLVSVPNKQMVDTMVDNWSMRLKRRAEIKLDLSVKTSLPQVQSFMESLKKFLDEQKGTVVSYTVFLKEINLYFSVVTEYFTDNINMDEFNSVKEKINLGILKLMEENTIEFADKDKKDIRD